MPPRTPSALIDEASAVPLDRVPFLTPALATLSLTLGLAANSAEQTWFSMRSHEAAIRSAVDDVINRMERTKYGEKVGEDARVTDGAHETRLYSIETALAIARIVRPDADPEHVAGFATHLAETYANGAYARLNPTKRGPESAQWPMPKVHAPALEVIAHVAPRVKDTFGGAGSQSADFYAFQNAAYWLRKGEHHPMRLPVRLASGALTPTHPYESRIRS